MKVKVSYLRDYKIVYQKGKVKDSDTNRFAAFAMVSRVNLSFVF